jgi:hypothetical protein
MDFLVDFFIYGLRGMKGFFITIPAWPKECTYPDNAKIWSVIPVILPEKRKNI